MGSSWLRAALPAAAGLASLGVGWFAVMFVLTVPLTWAKYSGGLGPEVLA